MRSEEPAREIQARQVAGRLRMLIVGAICETSIYRVAEVPPLPSKALASDMCQVIDGMALSAATWVAPRVRRWKRFLPRLRSSAPLGLRFFLLARRFEPRSADFL